MPARREVSGRLQRLDRSPLRSTSDADKKALSETCHKLPAGSHLAQVHTGVVQVYCETKVISVKQSKQLLQESVDLAEKSGLAESNLRVTGFQSGGSVLDTS